MMQDAASLQTNRTLLDNRGTIYSAGNQSTSVHPVETFFMLETSCVMYYGLPHTASSKFPKDILGIPL